MSDFLSTQLAAWVAMGMVAVGLIGAVYIIIGDEDSGMYRKWREYIAVLDKEVRFLFLPQSAEMIARAQVGGVLFCIVLYAFTGNFIFIALVAAGSILPLVVLRSKRTQRVAKLEEQLDGWLLLLANSLKATPAIGEAIRQTLNLVQPPMQQELDLLVKENQLGTPLDQAILNAAERIHSPMVGGSLAMLVVARQTGGDLPTILETSAGSLREMARLEGVVRTKTAEGKGQVWVLGSMPWLMAIVLAWMDETWWPTLAETFIGNLMLAGAFVLWAGAIFWGRTILDVDI